MKKNILLLGIAITFPTMALMAQAPRGPGHPPGPPPGGPGHDGGGPGGEVHDDPHRNPLFHALLRAIDTDGDGIISMSEMNHAADALLALDKNKDGKLSHDELCPPHHGPKDGPPPPPHGPKPDKGDKPDAEKDADAKPAADADKDKDAAPDKAPKDGNPPPPPEDEQRSALVDAIDTNHDGVIDASEIDAARANLKKLDMNHDGKLTPNEYGRPHHK